jgi:hypothetical protein
VRRNTAPSIEELDAVERIAGRRVDAAIDSVPIPAAHPAAYNGHYKCTMYKLLVVISLRGFCWFVDGPFGGTTFDDELMRSSRQGRKVFNSCVMLVSLVLSSFAFFCTSQDECRVVKQNPSTVPGSVEPVAAPYSATMETVEPLLPPIKTFARCAVLWQAQVVQDSRVAML